MDRIFVVLKGARFVQLSLDGNPLFLLLSSDFPRCEYTIALHNALSLMQVIVQIAASVHWEVMTTFGTKYDGTTTQGKAKIHITLECDIQMSTEGPHFSFKNLNFPKIEE